MKVFILEDSINRQRLFYEALNGHDVFLRDNAFDAIRLYNDCEPFDLMLLDHDLETDFMDATHDNTGSNFCRLLGKRDKMCQVIIHSYNPSGALVMEQTLRDNGWTDVQRVPFGLTILDALRNINELPGNSNSDQDSPAS